jgi:hypothetical protein
MKHPTFEELEGYVGVEIEEEKQEDYWDLYDEATDFIFDFED